MAEDLKTYNPQKSTTSSSIGRFVNFWGASQEQWRETRARVFRDFPGSVIVDGEDDWGAPADKRPQLFTRERDERYFPRDPAPIKVLACYHSGTSGITKSGIVVSAEDFEKLRAWYAEAYGRPLEEKLTVWREGME